MAGVGLRGASVSARECPAGCRGSSGDEGPGPPPASAVAVLGALSQAHAGRALPLPAAREETGPPLRLRAVCCVTGPGPALWAPPRGPRSPELRKPHLLAGCRGALSEGAASVCDRHGACFPAAHKPPQILPFSFPNEFPETCHRLRGSAVMGAEPPGSRLRRLPPAARRRRRESIISTASVCVIPASGFCAALCLKGSADPEYLVNCA